MLDEIGEDIAFLAVGLSSGDFTPRHEDYLRYFFAEEFENPEAPLESSRRRPTVSRAKIQAYLARHMVVGGVDSSMASAAFKVVGGVYSGFVHGASPQIMDMYGGDPPRFHLSGMGGTPRVEGARADLWNYFFRGLLSLAYAAFALQDLNVFEKIREYTREFESRSGTTYLKDSDEFFREKEAGEQ